MNYLTKQQLFVKYRGIALLFFIGFMLSCSKVSEVKTKEYNFPYISINKNLKKEILSFKEDLKNLQATKVSEISIFFFNKNDTLFIDIGNYRPNFQNVNIKGVEVINGSTVFLFNESNIELEDFYTINPGRNITIKDSLEPFYSYFDPYHRYYYMENGQVKLHSYNKCR